MGPWIPGFERFIDTPLATGVWGTLFFWAAVYSHICIHQGRTPLWPKRHLKFPRWWKAVSWITAAAIISLNIVAGAIIGLFEFQNLRLYLSIASLYLLTFVLLVRFGIMGYMLGYKKTNRDKKEIEDNNKEEDIEKISENWDEDADVEANNNNNESQQVSDRENPKDFFFTSKRILAMLICPMIAIDLVMHVDMIKICTLEETLPSYPWLFLMVAVLAVVITGFRTVAEIACPTNNKKTNHIGGWDVFWRVIAFFVFYHVFFTFSVAQAVLESFNDTVYGGIPYFEIEYVSDTGKATETTVEVAIRGYSFFAGSVVAFLLPLFSF